MKETDVQTLGKAMERRRKTVEHVQRALELLQPEDGKNHQAEIVEQLEAALRLVRNP